jgi:hypothetical protein
MQVALSLADWATILGYNGNFNKRQRSDPEQTFKHFLSSGSFLQFEKI